ncbi:terminase small subunit [Sneathiella sp.]|uniref:terminase small subunit n=1 Tax=Sneathiella sp. TaxID=1964365 RepID=UPI002FE37D0E
MARGKAKVKRPGEKVSLAQFASIRGCTDPTVRKYIRDGMPVDEKGAAGKASVIDTARAIDWLEQQAALAAGGQINSFDRDRARKMAADADTAEMNRDIQRGELVEVDVAVGLVADRIQTLRTRILNLPTKLAVKLAATRTREEAMELLEAELTQLLEELSGGAGGRN